MAIILPHANRVSRQFYESKGIHVRSEMGEIFGRAGNQDIETVGIVNTMASSVRPENEAMFAKLLAKSGKDVRLVLIHPTASQSEDRHTRENYKEWDQVADKLDRVILLGFPWARLDFEKVDFWEEYKQILADVRQRDIPAMYVCWSGMADLNQQYGARKEVMPTKLLGNYEYTTQEGGKICVPTARFTTINQEDLDNIIANEGMKVLLQTTETPEPQIGAFASASGRQVYFLSHPEYPYDTPPHDYLTREYLRDKDKADLGPFVSPPVRAELTQQQLSDREDWAVGLYKNWLNTPGQLAKEHAVQQQVTAKPARDRATETAFGAGFAYV